MSAGSVEMRPRFGFESVGVAAEGVDFGVADEPVDHGCGDLVAKDFSPAAEGLVAGDDERGAL